MKLLKFNLDSLGRRGGGGTHFICQDITCHMSVQCSAIQPSSIVQFSAAVGWFTKKYKKFTLKKNQAVES